MVRTLADAGSRVLLLAHAEGEHQGERQPVDITPLAVIALEDTVRSDAPEILAFFNAQGVTIKVISGDNPATVAAVSRRAGVPDAEVGLDARSLPDSDDDPGAFAEVVATTSVFGRVTPHQKRAMVRALQDQGHVVAMTGDGVNDVLALKDADMGIAMGAGSSATRAVAQLVLLDNKFSTLPRVLAEGRRVINNIERVANLFITKATYAVLLTILVGVVGVALPVPPSPAHADRHLLDRTARVLPGAVGKRGAGAPGVPAPSAAVLDSGRRGRRGARRTPCTRSPAG